MKARKSIPHLLVGLACLSLLAACGKNNTTNSSSNTKAAEKTSVKQLSQGQKANDFTLKDVNGKTYQLSKLKGKKVYLKFWASWCSICLASLPDANELAAKADPDTVVLSVVSPKHKGEKSEEDFKKWYKGLNYKSLPVLIDPEGKLLKEYGVRSYPTGVYIGTDGTIAKTHVGFSEKSEIEKTLKSIK
ncbi:TlpA family protein disulfide reductase [Streptococcus massiliensis]|uniref:Thiol-disulfide oxidoreductase n=1 Tax=Streptococcus massiliensis TaxID=313439 RepID=A0A380KXL2_9STRE|nr:TlpA disulfide reductase family protein [Streptococcus massiliensis]SUN75857.1 thiol-disulfide oxidoreductase [Streptococcus massiliensis]